MKFDQILSNFKDYHLPICRLRVHCGSGYDNGSGTLILTFVGFTGTFLGL